MQAFSLVFITAISIVTLGMWVLSSVERHFLLRERYIEAYKDRTREIARASVDIQNFISDFKKS